MSSNAFPTAPISPEILAAIRAVVNYNWADEQADYTEQDDEGRERHVFRSLRTISDWLDGADRRYERELPVVHQREGLPKRYRGRIDWDIEDAHDPAEAAAAMWRYVCESEGPVVELADRDTGEAHEVDLYELEHGHPFG